MSNVRFKLAAGLLGITLCGLAAVANSTGRPGSPLGCHKSEDLRVPITAPSPTPPVITKSTYDAILVAYQPPIEVTPVLPPPVVQEISLLPPVQAPAIPPLQAPDLGIPPIASVPQLTLPKVESNLPLPVGPIAPVVAQTPPPVLIVPEPTKAAPQAPVRPDVPNLELIPSPTTPVPQSAPMPQDGVKIVVRMTGSRPSLTLLCDNTEMLTLTCQELDLAARGPGEETVSAIKASGKVTFTAPGCQGTCEELMLNPKSWDGSMLKGVKVKCGQGNTATEMAADRMTFKLRSPKDSLVPTIAASHSTPARKD